MPTDGPPKKHALGVDFGTSNTVAVARWPDGRARPLLIDGSPLLPSAVYAEPDGQLLVGRDAVHSARLDPARFEPNPKRRIDDGTVLLGELEIAVVDLIAAVLARVAEEWHRAVGPVRPEVTLTCPATWGATRRGVLAEAAARVGLTGARLVAEPVAAATYFAEVLGRDVPIGSVVVVHDFGAGTFDASVVARTSEGFEVLAVDGRDDIGGLDIDAAIVTHLAERPPDDPGWARLATPSTLEERRGQRQLWDDARIAKERLSRAQSADLVVPLINRDVHLTRDELESLARPILDQTVQVTRGLLRWADLPEGQLAGVFLVGGASRIPLVGTLLHRELGEAPVVIEQPELVVAEGSILAGAALLASEPAAPGPTAELRLMVARRTSSVRESSSARDSPPVRESSTVPDSPPVRESSIVPDSPPVRESSTVPARPAEFPVDGMGMVRDHPPHDTASMPPAVDPWPDAAEPHWEPDPDATMIGDAAFSSWNHPSSVPPSPGGRSSTGFAAGGFAPGRASSGPPASAPPATGSATTATGRSAVVAPGGTRPFSSAQGGTRPLPPAPGDERRAPRDERHAPGDDGSASGAARETRGSGRKAGGARKADGGRKAGSERKAGSARKAGSEREAQGSARNARGSARPAPPLAPAPRQSAAPRPAPPPPPAPARKKRRGGFLVRFLKIIFTLSILVAVPLAVLIVGYGYGNGQPIQQDAIDVLRDIETFINRHL